MFSLCLALLFVHSACVCHKLIRNFFFKECNKKSTSKKKRKYKQ